MSDRGAPVAPELVVRELGPLGVSMSGKWCGVTGERSTALLAVLSMADGRAVPSDQLLDSVWPGPDRPATARQSLANSVARFRDRFGAGFIESTSHGYRLGDFVESDRARFESDVARARHATEPAEVLVAIELARTRWRGDPWFGLDLPMTLSADRARLLELRAEADRLGALAMVELGRHGDAIPLLFAAVDSDPDNDEVPIRLATALDGVGRRDQALAALADSRVRLARRGLEPRAEAADLERAMLGVRDHGREPTGTSPHQRLPCRPPPLVGRAALLARLRDLLGDRRLVTLVGPGGVGKTSVALEYAHGVDEAVFVDYSPVRDGKRCAEVLSRSLGVPPVSGVPAIRAAAEAVGDRQLIVVMDNCEHVLADARATAVALLEDCPQVRVLATSREALSVAAERALQVRPLADEADGAASSLFYACALDVGVELDRARWDPVVAELCARLDGLPLAIELAARRSVALDPGQIVAALDDRFALLRDDQPARRFSAVDDAVAWSWELLDDVERTAMAQIAVFPSGATIDTLADVLDWDWIDSVDIVERLCRKSLALLVRPTDGLPRVRLLETVRAWVVSASAIPALSRCRAAHVRWVDRFTSEVLSTEDRSASNANPLEALDAEAHEIRAALDHGERAGDPELATIALAVCSRLTDWWRGRDTADEASERLRALFRCATRAPAEIRVAAAAGSALLETISGGWSDETAERVCEARTLLPEITDPARRNHLEMRLLEGTFDLDDPTMPARLRRVAEAARPDGSTVEVCALHLLSAWTVHNRPRRAPEVAAALREASTQGTPASRAHATEQAGLAALATGHLDEARGRLIEALDRFCDIGQLFCAIHCCEAVAWLCAAQGDTNAAARLAAEVEGLRRGTGRTRAGFEEPAIRSVRSALGSLPTPDFDADLDRTIEYAGEWLSS